MAKIVKMEKHDGEHPHSALEMSDGTQEIVYDEIMNNEPTPVEPEEPGNGQGDNGGGER